MLSKIRKRLFEILEPPEDGDRFSTAFDVFILVLIALNITSIIVESMPNLPHQWRIYLRVLEIMSVGIFTVEYLLRLWTCTLNSKYKKPILGRIGFIISFMAMVDLLAILPFYLPMLIKADLRFFRALRLLRLFRVIKMGRYSNSLRIIGSIFQKKKEELFISAFVGVLILLIASSLIYACEHNAQPKAFSSIPATMWWGVTTLTTVGYGDMYPITLWGKIFASVIAFLSVGVFALPTAILGSAFLEEISQSKEQICPHCGKSIE